jgi:hypothetical protein
VTAPRPTDEQLAVVRDWFIFRLTDICVEHIDSDYWDEVWEVFHEAFGPGRTPSPEEILAVRQWVVDHAIAYSLREKRCDVVNEVLVQLFGRPPEPATIPFVYWRDSEGRNYGGYFRDGYNEAGYDDQGYGKDGWNKQGYDKDGYDKDGFHRSYPHRHRDTHLTRDEWMRSQDPTNVAERVAHWSPEYRAAVLEHLKVPEE